MSYDIVWNNDGTIMNFYGNISINEIDESNDMLYKDQRYETHKYSIANFLNATSDNTINEDSVMFPAAMDRGAAEYIKKMKIALVTTNKHVLRLCQHYIDISKILKSTWEFGIFSSVEEALIWGRATIPSKSSHKNTV
ncbi:MAG: hypothetical protein GY718_03820 [Lentisphaerae bacterium]|nr:hypothetical protein [Lentisphaerota bacterium]